MTLSRGLLRGSDGESLDGLVERQVKLFLAHLCLVGTSGHQPNETEGKGINTLLQEAKNGSNGSSEDCACQNAVLANKGVEQVGVNLDERGEGVADVLLSVCRLNRTLIGVTYHRNGAQNSRHDVLEVEDDFL